VSVAEGILLAARAYVSCTGRPLCALVLLDEDFELLRRELPQSKLEVAPGSCEPALARAVLIGSTMCCSISDLLATARALAHAELAKGEA
jgi:hypothetical protein